MERTRALTTVVSPSMPSAALWSCFQLLRHLSSWNFCNSELKKRDTRMLKEELKILKSRYFCHLRIARRPQLRSSTFSWMAIYVSALYLQCLQDENFITLRDMKRSKLSGHVFNILFTRDPWPLKLVIHSLYVRNEKI